MDRVQKLIAEKKVVVDTDCGPGKIAEINQILKEQKDQPQYFKAKLNKNGEWTLEDANDKLKDIGSKLEHLQKCPHLYETVEGSVKADKTKALVNQYEELKKQQESLENLKQLQQDKLEAENDDLARIQKELNDNQQS